MALAYGSFDELSHQLRFLLFEIGLGLPQQHINYYITLAHRACLQQLKSAAIQEQIIDTPIISHHVHDFLDQLQQRLKHTLPESRFFSWAKVHHQCNEAIANTALAHAYKKCWSTRLNKELGASSLWQWLEEQPQEHAALFLEQWGCLAQKIHPSLDKVYAYNRREVLQYGAEFQAQYSIHWAALKKEHTSFLIPFEGLLEKNYAQEYKSWQEKLSLYHVDPHHYYPLPIHPWMWRNHLQSNAASLIDNKSLILIPHNQRVTPSITPDIVMPTKSALHLNLVAEEECNLQENLSSLLTHEKNYLNTLFIAAKLEVLTVNPNSMAKDLGFSLIVNPNSFLKEEQIAIPLLSLFAQSPLAETSLINELIKKSGLNPISYFSQYCHQILFGPLHLLLKHGLSFNTQASNMILIFKNHLPQGMILREVKQIKMNQPHELESYPKDTGLHSELRKQFIYSILQNNLQYWVEHLHQEYQIERTYLWSTVRHALDNIFIKLSKELPASLLEQQKYWLFNEPWQSKPLLKQLLKPAVIEEEWIQQTNPLNRIIY